MHRLIAIDRQRGFVLVLVLWMSLALAFAVASFMTRERAESYRANAELTMAKTSSLAESAWAFAIADLMQNSEIHRYGQLVSRTIPNHDHEQAIVQYRIYDERGKVDLNKAPATLLQAMLESVLGDAFRAANLIKEINLRRSATTLLMSDLSEFGLSERELQRLATFVTAHNFSAYVNPRTASPELLDAIPGLGPTDVRAILRARESGLALPPLGSASEWLVEAQGPVYQIEAIGIAPNGEQVQRLAKVVQEGGQFRRSGGRFYELDRWTAGAL